MDEDVIRILLGLPLWEVTNLDQPSGIGDKKILREVSANSFVQCLSYIIGPYIRTALNQAKHMVILCYIFLLISAFPSASPFSKLYRMKCCYAFKHYLNW